MLANIRNVAQRFVAEQNGLKQFDWWLQYEA
jgi:hypothetical protein